MRFFFWMPVRSTPILFSLDELKGNGMRMALKQSQNRACEVKVIVTQSNEISKVPPKKGVRHTSMHFLYVMVHQRQTSLDSHRPAGRLG